MTPPERRLDEAVGAPTASLGNDGRVLMRRILCLLSPVFGIGVVLSACSSSQQSTSPRSACSLLSAEQASAALGGVVQPPSECQVGPGNQSVGLYSGGKPGGSLMVNVSWGTEAVTTFTVSHGGQAHSAAGVTPPVYSRVTVSGISAYWQLSPPPITVILRDNNSAPTGSVLKISTLKNGYVATLTSVSLSQSQDEQALASIINRL